MKTYPIAKKVRRTIRFKKNRWSNSVIGSDAAIIHAAHECANARGAIVVRAVMRENNILNTFTTCKIVFYCEKDKWPSIVTLFLSVVKNSIQDVSYTN